MTLYPDSTASACYSSQPASSATGNIPWLRLSFEICRECGGAVKVIASIEDLSVISKILTHLDDKVASAEPRQLPETLPHCRAVSVCAKWRQRVEPYDPSED